MDFASKHVTSFPFSRKEEFYTVLILKRINLRCIYRFSTDKVVFFPKSLPRVNSLNILKISQNSGSIYLQNIFLLKKCIGAELIPGKS